MTELTRPRPAWVPDALYPFTDRWIEIDGHVVHYVDEGSGPALLLLNGNPSWSFGWRDVILGLRGRFRCIAPDYPGFGLSDGAPGFDYRPRSQSFVVEALADRLLLEDVTVVGYGWGGPIGLGLAGRRPELVHALVLGNTWGWPVRRITARLFSALFGGPLGWLTVERLDLLLRVFLPRGLRRAPLTEAELAAYAGPWRGPRRRRIMRVFPREVAAGRRYRREVEAALPRLVDKPVLLLRPDRDRGFTKGDLRRLQALFPHATTVGLENTGQFIDEDAPAEIVAAIETWWAEEVEPEVQPLGV